MAQYLPQLLTLIVVFPLIAFWLWMFVDMNHNDALPNNSAGPLTWPPSSKYNWTLAFIVLSIFAACYYYVYEYRRRH